MNVLVLNMGMKSIRSIIFDGNGKKISSASRTLTSAINDTRVEQYPDEWWDKAVEVMKESIKDAKIINIDYITATTSASCLVCMNGAGHPLGNAIMVSDKRAIREVDEIKKCAAYALVEEDTGLPVCVSVMLPKILWIKNNDPQVFTDAKFFLTPNDYLIYHLCGNAVTDELNALKYHYSFSTTSYPTQLLNELGIPEKKLPPVMKTGNVAGTVTVFRMLSKKDALLPSNRVYTTPFHQGNFNIIGGSNNLGGGLIEWVKQCYYAKEEYPYEVMEKEAAESDIGARGIIFLPYLLGERTPIWNDNARGTFFGLERMHTRKDMTRAVFEAAAFIDRTMMEAIGETSADVTTVRLSGGLARVGLISQIKADVTGKEVIILSEFETTASGAAMMVLNGQEGISFDELSRGFSKSRMTIHPDMDNHEKYNVVYKLFKETYQQLVPMFDRRIELLETIRSSRETQIENL